jgi:hypothetical protein
MASEDSSFNASGCTVVAFETITGPEDRAFGVSVVANVCGVFGQGSANPQDDRTSPKGTGVLGMGDVHGVYGVGAFPAIDIGIDAPDFSEFSPAGAAVIGVTQSDFPLKGGPSGSPAIVGLNDLLKGDFDINSPVNSRATLLDATKEPIAVAGLSRVGHGVCGLSLNMLDRKVDLPAQPGVNLTLQGSIGPDLLNPGVMEETQAAGVIGIAMDGPGLRGVSLTDRGAIFQSATIAAEAEANPSLGVPASPPVAQIRLVPHPNLQAPAGQEPPLPANGKMGDLLALAVTDANRQIRADLWFCVGIDSDTKRALWGKLAFSQVIAGTEP